MIAVIEEHGQLLAAEMGEDRGVRDLRKHVGWYLKGYPVGGQARNTLMRVSTLEGLHEALAAMRARLPEKVPYPGETGEGPAAGPALPSARTCPTAGWTPPISARSTGRSSSTRSPTSPEDERAPQASASVGV